MSEGISYQNMDIEFKILSEHYKEKSFKAYGLDLPKIKKVLPANMPVIKADEKRIDNLFLLEDGTIAIVDYEAADKLNNRIKYMNYITRVMEKYYQDVKKKLENNEPLMDEDLMQLIILPLTEKGKEKKQRRIEEVVNLAKQIYKDAEQAFVLAGILVSSDQFINKEYANQVRRWLGMTKVGRIFEEEKLDALREQEAELTKKFARKLILGNVDVVDIMNYTGLSRKEIEEMQSEIKS